MIYTLGIKVVYDAYIASSACPMKRGGRGSYPGGSVWRTVEEAKRYLTPEHAVYGVEADWDRDTVPSGEGDWHDLLVSSRLVLLEETGVAAMDELRQELQAVRDLRLLSQLNKSSARTVAMAWKWLDKAQPSEGNLASVQHWLSQVRRVRLRHCVAVRGVADGTNWHVAWAKYAKRSVAFRHTGRDDLKSRGDRLAEALKGRWSNRERAYIMSRAKFRRLRGLLESGWDASTITGELIRPA